MNREQKPNVGIDVSKQHLDVCLGTDRQRVLNDASGGEALIRQFKEAGVDLIVIEATGGHERDLVWALQNAGLAVARVNPRQSPDKAPTKPKSMGELSKTDEVDARMLRDFADVLVRHKDRAKHITR